MARKKIDYKTERQDKSKLESKINETIKNNATEFAQWKKHDYFLGRPDYWTEDQMAKLAFLLHKWGETEGNIFIQEFEADNYISRDILAYLIKKSSHFSRMYELTRKKCSARLAKTAGKSDGVHYRVFEKYACLYDKELDLHERDRVEHEANAKETARVNATRRLVEAMDGKKSIMTQIGDEIAKYITDKPDNQKPIDVSSATAAGIDSVVHE